MLKQSPQREQEVRQYFPKMPLENGRDVPILPSWGNEGAEATSF
jgi:hypothetical protein